MWFEIPKQINNDADNKNGWEKVCPDIYSLIMGHEQAFENFLGSVKTYSITMSYVLIVLHVGWGFLVMANKLVFTVFFFRSRRLRRMILLGVFLVFWGHKHYNNELDKKWHHKGDK